MKKQVLLVIVLMYPGLAVLAQDNAERPAVKEARHSVVDGDTLWDLSKKYYGNPYDWNRIYDANKTAIKDPHWIYPHMQLTIPEVLVRAEEVQSDASTSFEEETPPAMPVSARPQEQPVAGIRVSSGVAGGPSRPAQAAVAAVPAVGGTVIKRRAKPDEISADMPIDMTWGFPSKETQLVSTDWKADGKITLTDLKDPEDELASLGDKIAITFSGAKELAVGDLLNVYRRGVYERDEKGNAIALELQNSAVVKVLQIDGDNIEAEIIKLTNPVEKGDLVKKIQGKL